MVEANLLQTSGLSFWDLFHLSRRSQINITTEEKKTKRWLIQGMFTRKIIPHAIKETSEALSSSN